MGIFLCGDNGGMAHQVLDDADWNILFHQSGGEGVPLRYNNDKRKKPLFSRSPRVCRHLFNSFSKLKFDEKIIKKRRLFH